MAFWRSLVACTAVLLLIIHGSHCFYLPGVAPQDFQKVTLQFDPNPSIGYFLVPRSVFESEEVRSELDWIDTRFFFFIMKLFLFCWRLDRGAGNGGLYGVLSFSFIRSLWWRNVHFVRPKELVLFSYVCLFLFVYLLLPERFRSQIFYLYYLSCVLSVTVWLTLHCLFLLMN